MEKVQFETNVPITLALRFATGKTVKSQIDGSDQTMFTTTDGRVMFLSEFAAQKINALGLKPAEPFTFCKREVRNGEGKPRIEWQASKVGGQASSAPATPAVTAQTTPNGSTSPQHTPPTKVPYDRAISRFLVIAGRSVREAETQLAAEGGSVRFDNRDVAALATTMFIQSAREGWLTWIEEPPQPTAREKAVAAQQAIAAGKIEDLQRKAATSETTVTEERPWKTRGEMKQVFAQLREQCGETAYLEVMNGKTPEQIRYLNDAMAMYHRLLKIAQEEAA